MTDYNGKKLLILAGQDEHRKVIEEARKLGVYTIITDYLEKSPSKAAADEASMVSILDVDGLIELCRKKNVDGIMSFCNDMAPAVIQQVCDVMGYPNKGTAEQIATFCNKRLFKNACIENGVEVVPEYTREDIDAGNYELPVMVKPVNSRGSRGSRLCMTEEELKETLKEIDGNPDWRGALMEKSMVGRQELSITYIVVDGEPHLISVADRHSGRPEDNVDKILSVMMQPSWSLDLYLSTVDANVKKMIRSVGVQNSPVFMQGFVDEGVIRMFDPGYRFPGNEYERVLLAATGVNTMKCIITYALSGHMDVDVDTLDECYNLKGLCGVQYMVNVRPGIIAGFEGVEEVEKHPNLVYLGKKYEPGVEIFEEGDTRRRAFDISFLVERNEEAVKEVIRFVDENLKVLDADGNNMVVSPFDFDKVKHRYPWTQG